MTSKKNFNRKAAYLLAIVVLLVPLSWLSRPASARGKQGQGGSPGGHLAQLRSEHNLSQSSLGEIDPTSETMKLAVMGVRGFAACILWNRSQHYKKTEDWTSLEATLDQISYLQPHFISVWKYQSWNLSYNVSAEFDDYRDRYHWVKTGIEFVMRGATYNQRDPRFHQYLGFVITQKIGRSDERVQFRRLFKNDTEFHNKMPFALVESHRGPDDKPDNWLVGRQWYLDSESLVDNNEDIKVIGKSQVLFFSEAPKCLINFAQAIQREGVSGPNVQAAWERAATAWKQFSQRPIENHAGLVHQVNDRAWTDVNERIEAAIREIQGIEPDRQREIREQLRAERREALDEELKDALAIDKQRRTKAQQQLAEEAERRIESIRVDEIIRRIPKDAQARVYELAQQILVDLVVQRAIESSRHTTNFASWQRRCEYEQTQDAQDAHMFLFEAERQFEKGRHRRLAALRQAGKTQSAEEFYMKSFQAWSQVFEKYPQLYLEPSITQDLVESVEKYRLEVLREAELPEDFPLAEMLRREAERLNASEAAPVIDEGDKKQPAEKDPPQPADASQKPAA